ncbi:MAG: thiamine-phosphate kinase [Candidatus Omnitrophica bacterium]|nr:thiamine-phosphate kinase [Candidatus Omnitrophota bacterium]
MKICDVGEISLIRRFSKKIRLDKTVVKGSGDDTAVIKWTPDKYLLYTCDMLVEGAHFRLAKARPFQIGWKALGRNISDIAAMGGIPRYAVVSMGIDPESPVSIADGVVNGILALAKKFKVNIVGGDLSRSKKLIIDISLIGEVEKKNLTLRSGAKIGDLVFVTGTIGASQKGKHLNFTPRLDEARALVKKFKINSMIDVSDGLLLDLWRILDASKVGARIYEKLVPISKNAGSFKKAISEGEDFELLFTMTPKEALKAAKMKLKTPASLIGQIIDGENGLRLAQKDGVERLMEAKGFLHF